MPQEKDIIFYSTPDATITNMVLRELNIIDTKFKVQYLKYDENAPVPYLLDENGRSGIDGRYINFMDIYSNVELFNVPLFKKEFDERYEKTNNLSLLTANYLK